MPELTVQPSASEEVFGRELDYPVSREVSNETVRKLLEIALKPEAREAIREHANDFWPRYFDGRAA